MSNAPALRAPPLGKRGELLTLPLLKGEYGKAGRELMDEQRPCPAGTPS